VVVEREVNGTNKTTRRSGWRGLFKKRTKGLDRADIVRDVRLPDQELVEFLAEVPV
jgi:hypothetical protein